VVDIYHTLEEYSSSITICDPWADAEKAKKEYGIDTISNIPEDEYDAIILCVAHKEFLEVDINKLRKSQSVVYDVKGVLNRNLIDGRL
jgi:UDP-N-acetyl-D-galactosamine dehydrogenase